MNRTFLIVAAILGIFVLFEATSGVKLASPGSPDKTEVAAPAAPIGSKPIPATKRANSPGFDENSPDPNRLSCLQLQVVDEIDLLGDADCK